MDVEAFIARWQGAPGSERGHAHSFLIQLCHLIGVPAPNDQKAGDPNYAFERIVRFSHDDASAHWGFIDCYRRGCFVLEAKQSRKRLAAKPDLAQMDIGWFDTPDRLMGNAKAQAQGYARALDEWPPFLIIVDVGRSIELWSDFSRMGKSYTHFPDRETYRIDLSALRDPKIRHRLATVWSDPMSLDPAARIAAATNEIAALLGRLVQSLRSRAPQGADGKVDPVHRASWDKRVAVFVMQCLFAMFADSVGLIEDRAFSRLLRDYRGGARNLHGMLSQLFQKMNTGGHSHGLRRDVRCFNGGLYAEDAAMPLTEPELEMLCEAADRDWSLVEPAIFGTLMESALSPDERSQLGAHYTPKAYVEMIIQATLMDVLRRDWEAISIHADNLEKAGRISVARGLVDAFHRAVCGVIVLDPACGTANFLYVAMDRMKDLEAEVIERMVGLGMSQRVLETDRLAVGPSQFLGLEKSSQAVWIAKLVMWIGHLQWHYRLWGRVQPSDPILKNYDTIEATDAIVAWEEVKAAPDATDGVRYVSPHAPAWPKAHFIIGNPPFIAGKDLRRELGSAYVEALWTARGQRHRSADIVMAWWDRAAEILIADAGEPGPFTNVIDELKKRRSGHVPPHEPALQRFGFITTNSITQTFSRRVIEERLNSSSPIRLTFAIPDHPWIKGEGAAAVRIAMSVAEAGAPDGRGRVLRVIEEADLNTDRPRITYVESTGDIGADLTIGRDLDKTSILRANASLAHRGVQLMGDGFLLSADRAQILASVSEEGLAPPVRLYRNGKDLTEHSRDLRAIDFFGWTEEDARRQHPGFMQHLMEAVKPDRDRNNRASYRDAWWIFGEPRRELRAALKGLSRYIVTVETAKHRWFRFLDASILPDNRLVCIASDDPFVLGVLSSRVHLAWALAVGGLLEDRPVYAKGLCFDRFAFPTASTMVRREIGVAAEALDELRARVLTRHPELTMTGLYNVMGRLKRGEALTSAESQVRLAGCLDLLLDGQERLDRMVLGAYGWPSDLDDATMVSRLVTLNQARAAEEAEGVVRLLRPAYQETSARRNIGGVQFPAARHVADHRPSLSNDQLETIMGVLDVLRDAGKPLTTKDLAARFQIPKGAKNVEKRLQQTLEMLTAAESIYQTDAGWFAPRRTPS